MRDDLARPGDGKIPSKPTQAGALGQIGRWAGQTLRDTVDQMASVATVSNSGSRTQLSWPGPGTGKVIARGGNGTTLIGNAVATGGGAGGQVTCEVAGVAFIGGGAAVAVAVPIAPTGLPLDVAVGWLGTGTPDIVLTLAAEPAAGVRLVGEPD